VAVSAERGFARGLRRLRARRGWSQQRLAGDAGTSPQTLSRIEQGERCTLGIAHAIATALDTTVDAMIRAGLDPEAPR
jgi:transcriptional regulator with XRE-family HTH domain